IAFLMDQAGTWRLSPAFDITWSYNPNGEWTSRHQMAMNGKRDKFDMDAFYACAQAASLSKRAARGIIDEVRNAVLHWPEHAKEAGVDRLWQKNILASLRTLT